MHIVPGLQDLVASMSASVVVGVGVGVEMQAGWVILKMAVGPRAHSFQQLILC